MVKKLADMFICFDTMFCDGWTDGQTDTARPIRRAYS